MTWDENILKGQILVKEDYSQISLDHISINKDLWFQKTWKWEIPLKINCFMWLVAHNKTLTWENLFRKACSVQGDAKYVRNSQKAEDISLSQNLVVFGEPLLGEALI